MNRIKEVLEDRGIKQTLTGKGTLPLLRYKQNFPLTIGISAENQWGYLFCCQS